MFYIWGGVCVGGMCGSSLTAFFTPQDCGFNWFLSVHPSLDSREHISSYIQFSLRITWWAPSWQNLRHAMDKAVATSPSEYPKNIAGLLTATNWTVNKDGRHVISTKVKPKHLLHSLVGGLFRNHIVPPGCRISWKWVFEHITTEQHPLLYAVHPMLCPCGTDSSQVIL